MPKYVAPRNDLERLGFIERSLATGKQDQGADKNYLSPATISSLEAFNSQYKPVVQQVAEKKGALSMESQESGEALDLLKTHVRDFWEVGKRRAARQDQPADVLTFYQLQVDGNVPKPTTREAWLALAEQVVQGDANAVAAGYPPMVNPSAAEVQEALDIAKKEATDVSSADREYDSAQEAVAGMREKADDLIDDVIAELRFTLRKMDSPSQRRVMRTYGAKFRYLRDEQLDPDDQAPAE